MTLIIAEAGVNHNGDINLASELIKAAADSGADIIKFQTFKSNNLSTSYASKANYQNSTTNAKSQQEMLSELELKQSDHWKLIEICEKYDIEFLSSGFDLESLNFLSTLNLKRIKIPSGEITNIPYLRKAASINKSLIISSGMATLGEIEVAINILEKEGITRNMMTILHCTTEYPAPFSEVNLKAISTIKNALKVSVGYSDHTIGIEVPIAAVALGSSIIEKHFTIDKNLYGPDHKASLEPKEFTQMVKSIRRIENSLGDGIKRATKSELSNIESVRKSIVAAKRIEVGDLFTKDNLTTKRPGSGISPLRWDDLIGLESRYLYEPDDLIKW